MTFPNLEREESDFDRCFQLHFSHISLCSSVQPGEAQTSAGQAMRGDMH